MAKEECVCAADNYEVESDEEELKPDDIVETMVNVNISFSIKENLIVKESDKLYEVKNQDGTKDFIIGRKGKKITVYTDCQTGKKTRLRGRKVRLLVPELGGGWEEYTRQMERIYKEKLSRNSQIKGFKLSIE